MWKVVQEPAEICVNVNTSKKFYQFMEAIERGTKKSGPIENGGGRILLL